MEREPKSGLVRFQFGGNEKRRQLVEAFWASTRQRTYVFKVLRLGVGADLPRKSGTPVSGKGGGATPKGLCCLRRSQASRLRTAVRPALTR